MNKYIDSHTHLHSYNTKKLLNPITNIENWQQAWSNAQKANVVKILNIYNITSKEELNIMPEMYNIDNIYIASAVHPCNIHEITLVKAQEIIESLIPHIHCIGETGLDIYNNITSLNIQIEFLKMHIKLAHLYNKPLILHLRNKNENNDEFIQIIYNLIEPYSDLTFVLHACTFDYKTIQPLLKFKNCFVSISGIVTYKNGINVQDLARNVSLEKLLLETDSPYLHPDVKNINRYKTNNESANIIYIYEKVAEIRNMNLEILINIIYDNFNRFLKNDHIINKIYN